MSIKKVREGWRIDYRDQNGRRYRKTYRLQQAAKDALRDIHDKIDMGVYVSPREMPTFQTVAEDWYASKRGYRHSTLAFWRTHLDNHLLLAFGPIPVDKLDLARVERKRDAWLAENEIAAPTVNKLLTTLTAILNVAVKRKLVAANVTALVDRARAANAGELNADGEAPDRESGEVREEDVLSLDEIRKLLEKAEPGLYRTLLMTAALTGARHDELLALQWGDIDLDANKIVFRRNLSWAKLPDEKTRPRFYEPKSKAGRRTIPCPPDLTHALKVWRLQCPVSPLDLVFPTPGGQPMHRSNVLRRGLYPALKRAELRRVSMHSLRHSFASMLIARGTPITEVTALMGHAKATTTLRVYAHWFRQTESDATRKLAAELFRPAKQTDAR